MSVNPGEEPRRQYETWLARVRSEYFEMPGLSLTAGQAQRLWGLDVGVCTSLLDALVRSGFLQRNAHGLYVRAAAL